jgi:hypothetical protein
VKQLKPSNLALKSGRTIFLKSIKDPATVKRLLQPASSNSKLGGKSSVISKGKWRGMYMYSLSLEERATCPRTCNQWTNCYGNNMPFANRLDHTDPSFLTLLSTELGALAVKHPQGFVIRLHVLGDFYSTAYVKFWSNALATYPNLRLFGYTHRSKTSLIGKSIMSMNSERCWIRWSDAGGEMSANADQLDGTIGEGITCPEQTEKTASCLTCGLCWSTPLPIRFITH